MPYSNNNDSTVKAKAVEDKENILTQSDNLEKDIATFLDSQSDVTEDIVKQEAIEDIPEECEVLKKAICSEEKSSYEKKEEQKEELEEDRKDKKIAKKISFLSKMAKSINEKLKNIPIGATNITKNIYEGSKNIAGKVKEKVSNANPWIKAGLLYAAMKAIQKLYQWYEEASNHQYGIIGWIAEKLIEKGSIFWEKIKEFFTSENFIYKLFWGEDGTGENSGLWYQIKKFFTSENFIYKWFWGEDGSGNTSGILFEVKKYFSSGQAWNDIVKGTEWYASLWDDFYTLLFGEHYTNAKDWVQKQLTAILDWWDEVQSKGGLLEWIKQKLYYWFKSSDNAIMQEIGDAIKPASVEKEEAKIEAHKKELNTINQNIEKDNKAKSKEWSIKYRKFYDKTVKEVRQLNKEGRYEEAKNHMQVALKKWQEENPRPETIKPLTFEEYQEIKNSTRKLDRYSNYSQYLMTYNKQYSQNRNANVNKSNANINKSNTVVKPVTNTNTNNIVKPITNNNRNTNINKSNANINKSNTFVKPITNNTNTNNIVKPISNNTNTSINANSATTNNSKVNKTNLNISQTVANNVNNTVKNNTTNYASVKTYNEGDIFASNNYISTNPDGSYNININNKSSKIENNIFEDYVKNIKAENIKKNLKIQGVQSTINEKQSAENEVLVRGLEALNYKIEAFNKETVTEGFLGSVQYLDYGV